MKGIKKGKTLTPSTTSSGKNALMGVVKKQKGTRNSILGLPNTPRGNRVRHSIARIEANSWKTRRKTISVRGKLARRENVDYIKNRHAGTGRENRGGFCRSANRGGTGIKQNTSIRTTTRASQGTSSVPTLPTQLHNTRKSKTLSGYNAKLLKKRQRPLARGKRFHVGCRDHCPKRS